MNCKNILLGVFHENVWKILSIKQEMYKNNKRAFAGKFCEKKN